MASISPNHHHHHIDVKSSPKTTEHVGVHHKPQTRVNKKDIHVPLQIHSLNNPHGFALPKDGSYAYPYRKTLDDAPSLTSGEHMKRQIAIYYHYTFCWFHLLFNIFMMAVCVYSLIAAPTEALTIYMVLVTLYQFATCGVCIFTMNGGEFLLQVHTLFNAFATIFHAILVLVFICVFDQAMDRLGSIDASNANYSTVMSFYTLLKEYHVLFRVILCLDLVGLLLSVFLAKWEINYHGRKYIESKEKASPQQDKPPVKKLVPQPLPQNPSTY